MSSNEKEESVQVKVYSKHLFLNKDYNSFFYGPVIWKEGETADWESGWISFLNNIIFIFSNGTLDGRPSGKPSFYIECAQFKPIKIKTGRRDTYKNGFFLKNCDNPNAKKISFLSKANARTSWLNAILSSNILYSLFCSDIEITCDIPSYLFKSELFEKVQACYSSSSMMLKEPMIIDEELINKRLKLWMDSLKKVLSETDTHSLYLYPLSNEKVDNDKNKTQLLQIRAASFEAKDNKVIKKIKKPIKSKSKNTDEIVYKDYFDTPLSLYIMHMNFDGEELFKNNKDEEEEEDSENFDYLKENNENIKNIPLDHDIYVIGVQNCLNSNLFELLNDRFVDYDYEIYGALEKNSNAIVVFTPKDSNNVEIIEEFSFSIDNKIKSPVISVLAKINNVSVIFCNLFFPHNYPNKVELFQNTIKTLGELYGDENFSVLEQFNHVVLFGCFNIQNSELTEDDCKTYIEKGNVNIIKLKDDFTKSIVMDYNFYRFREPIPKNDHIPTYRKQLNRLNTIDYEDEEWFMNEYDLSYINKNSTSLLDKIRSKKNIPNPLINIPHYADRILIFSIDDLKYTFFPKTSKNNEEHVYGSFHPDFVGSPHSPIFSEFILKTPSIEKSNIEKIFNINIFRLNIFLGSVNQKLEITNVKILFPLHYEDSGSKTNIYTHYDRTPVKKDDSRLNILRLKSKKDVVEIKRKDIIANVQWRTNTINPIFHAAVKVETRDDIVGCCTFRLYGESFSSKKTLFYNEVLINNGLPCVSAKGLFYYLRFGVKYGIKSD